MLQKLNSTNFSFKQIYLKILNLGLQSAFWQLEMSNIAYPHSVPVL